MLKSLVFILAIITLTSNFKALASSASLSPPIRTNTNVVTSEFETYISDKRGLDIQTEEGRNAGARSAEIPNIADLLSPEGVSKLSIDQGRLSSIDENYLEVEGRMERNKPENAYFDDFETDYTTSLGSIAHKRDVDEIVSATNVKLGELTRTLKDIGIDCREIKKADEIKDPYHIEIEMEETKETEYDQKFCEQPRNNYNCSSNLKLTCRHKFSVPLEGSRFFTSLPKSYDGASGILTFGWPYNFTQAGGHGTQYDYKVNFRIDELETVSEFVLKEIGYDDFVRVTINGHQIFAGPFGGDRLELLRDKTIYDIRAGSIFHLFPYYGVVIDGSELVHCADQFEWRVVSTHIDLRRFLKEGENSLDIRLIVGGGGGIWLKFSAKVNACNSWNEIWEEQCTHRN